MTREEEQRVFTAVDKDVMLQCSQGAASSSKILTPLACGCCPGRSCSNFSLTATGTGQNQKFFTNLNSTARYGFNPISSKHTEYRLGSCVTCGYLKSVTYKPLPRQVHTGGTDLCPQRKISCINKLYINHQYIKTEELACSQ